MALDKIVTDIKNDIYVLSSYSFCIMDLPLQTFQEESNLILGSNSNHFHKSTHQPSVRLLKGIDGHPVVWLTYKEIESTMIPAEKWPEHYLNQFSFVFQAQSQSAGKGQGSNVWTSPPGNIYLTVLSRVKPNLATFLPILGCSAVMQTIREQISGLQVRCKWVNDILVQGKKVAGILSNGSISGQNFTGIIGIGINIGSAPLKQSTSLQKYKQSEIDLTKFTERLIIKLFTCLEQKDESLLQYQKSLLFKGSQVRIMDRQLKNTLHQGIFMGVNDLGHAILEKEGQKIQVHSGRMRLKEKAAEQIQFMIEQSRASYLI